MQEDEEIYMVSKYHKNIQNELIRFGKKCDTVKKVVEGNRTPITIVEAKSKKVGSEIEG